MAHAPNEQSLAAMRRYGFGDEMQELIEMYTPEPLWRQEPDR